MHSGMSGFIAKRTLMQQELRQQTAVVCMCRKCQLARQQWCRHDLMHSSVSVRTTKVVRHNVRAHFEVVDDERGQGWCGAEQAAVDHQKAEISRLQPCMQMDTSV